MKIAKPKNKSIQCPREILGGWMSTITNESSIHGLVWYNRTSNRCLKFVFVIFALLAVILLPMMIAVEAFGWMQTQQVTINEERKAEDSMTYPPIVICHPKFFDASKMAGITVII